MHLFLRPRLCQAAAALLAAAPAAAQAPAPDLRTEVPAGGETERYLRALQVAGAVPLYPWTLRGLSPAELDVLVPADSAHPWAARLAPDSGTGLRVAPVRPRMDLAFNSGFPQGENDGPVWAGRGMTVVASAGVHLRAGPVTVRLEPLAYWTENRAFELMPNELADSLPFREPRFGSVIDLPQRFGDRSFARLSPGESSVRLDLRGVAAGLSTATQVWGPAIDQPLLLGANTSFPHAFLGTSRPWNVGIGRLHARVVWGSLGQSEWSPMMRGHGSRRFMSGLVASFQPRGLQGLEVGLTRFFHDPWPSGGLGLSNALRPVESFFLVNLWNTEKGNPHGVENQLASLFFRWVLQKSGTELYGEYLRDDYSWDLLDAILEPDRASGYMLGGRRVWLRGSRMLAARAELVQTQQSHAIQAQYVGPRYLHTVLLQGHTAGGQLLASPAGYGGGGSVVAVEGYTPRGRWSVDWTRTRVRGPLHPGGEQNGPVDVMHSVGGEAAFFRGRVDAVARLRGTLEFNRHFDDDAFNLTAGLGLRVGF